MSLISFTSSQTQGLVGVQPGLAHLNCTDSYAKITTAGYLYLQQVLPTDFVFANYGTDGSSFGLFTPNISNGIVTLNAYTGTGTQAFITALNNSGQSVAANTSSATPGTLRALRGQMVGTATTMSSGNLVGLRGEVDCVGASGGFLYGAQGKVISTGTLSGSSWTAGVFGQLDISAATVNAGQTAVIWGDYGSTSGTITSAAGMRGIAMTNTTAAVLNAQDYRYGNATYLQELAGAGGTLNYYAAAGTSSGSAGNSTHCAAQQVLKILINGVAAYIPVFTQNT